MSDFSQSESLTHILTGPNSTEMSSTLVGPSISPHYISIKFVPLHFKCNYVCHNRRFTTSSCQILQVGSGIEWSATAPPHVLGSTNPDVWCCLIPSWINNYKLAQYLCIFWFTMVFNFAWRETLNKWLQYLHSVNQTHPFSQLWNMHDLKKHTKKTALLSSFGCVLSAELFFLWGLK